jgi:hypothetical protein
VVFILKKWIRDQTKSGTKRMDPHTWRQKDWIQLKLKLKHIERKGETVKVEKVQNAAKG